MKHRTEKLRSDLKEVTQQLSLNDTQLNIYINTVPDTDHTDQVNETLDTQRFQSDHMRHQSLPSLHRCYKNAANNSFDKNDLNETTMATERNKTLDLKKYQIKNQYLSLKSTSVFEKEFNLSHIIRTHRENAQSNDRLKKSRKSNARTSRLTNLHEYEADSIVKNLTFKNINKNSK